MAKEYRASILSVYDSDRQKISIPAIKGESAYEYAVNNGYSGSKDQFAYDCNPENIKRSVEGFILDELAQRGQVKPEFANDLEELKQTGDTSKIYVLPDNYIYIYKKTKKPYYENLIEWATTDPINTTEKPDKSLLYNGVGYLDGWRWSSSSKGPNETTEGRLTGWIKYVQGGTLRLKNFGLTMSVGYVAGGYIVQYHNDGSTTIATIGRQTVDEFTYTMNATGVTHFRISAYGSGSSVSPGAPIVTINEEIKEGFKEEFAWTKTDFQFVAADYEGRIVNLERDVLQNAQDIYELQNKTIEGGTGLIMYISPSGLDENDGLSKSSPKKTVSACVAAGAARISAKRGVYKERISFVNTLKELEIFPTDNDLTYSTGLVRDPIIFDMSDTIDTTSIVSYNSIKRFAYSNSENTCFDKVFIKQSQTPLYGDGYGSRYNATMWLFSEDEKQVCLKLKPVLTVAECEAEVNTFVYSENYVYFNADMTSVTKVIVPTIWENAINIEGADRLILKEVEVRFGGCYNINVKNCAYFDFYKCACKYTTYGSGFHPLNSNGIMTSCYATKNFDGYGISGYGHTTYVDCVSEFNFDDGMSHHDATTGTVIGGRYEGNGKGGNTPAYGAKVNIYGGIYKNNASFGIGYLSASSSGHADGKVEGAILVDNPIGLVVNANCNVTASGCVYKDNTKEKEIKGNLTEYNGSYVSNEGNDNNINDSETIHYTNLLKEHSYEADRTTPYNNGKGYKMSRRLSASSNGAETSAQENSGVTGFIEAKVNDVIRIQGTSPISGQTSYLMTYDSSNTLIGYQGLYQNNGWGTNEFMIYDATNDILTIPLTKDYFGTGFNAFRLSVGFITDNTVITKNQSILKEDSTSNETYEQSLLRIKNWKYPIFEDAPVFLLKENKPAIAKEEQNTAAVYAKYDALMAQYPWFITKEDLGLASDNETPLYAYHFKEPTPHYPSGNWSETKPVILICSGVHPTEQTGIHCMYHALEEITTNDELLDLRRNLHFIVMPVINPTGWSDSVWGVRNPDGIQVHYNFEVDFKYPEDSGYVEHGNRNHGGETPLSIPETIAFDNLMQEHKDNLACVLSCHNNDVDTRRGTDYVWCSCATHFMCNIGFRLADKMSAAWRKKYGTQFDEGLVWANEYALQKAAEGSSIFNPDYILARDPWDYRVGMASLSGSGGTEYKQALKYGVHGINVEACDRCLVLDRDWAKTRTENVVTVGTETYINFFRIYMAAYDPKNKKDYAPNLPQQK